MVAGSLFAACGVSSGSSEPLAIVTLASGEVEEITQGELREIVSDINSSDRFVESVYGGTVPADSERNVLSRMINEVVLNDEAQSLGVDVDQESIEEAEEVLRSQLEASFTQAAIADPVAAADEVASEIQSYFDLVAGTLATSQALQESYSADIGDDVEGGLPCVRHILVAPEDADLADSLFEQLEGGADFAALAAEVSIDTTSAVNGGELGCADPNNYVPEFRDAVIGAEMGEVVGPVESDFGFHIIEVTGFDNAQLVGLRFQEAFADVTVDVNSEFGAWDPATQSVVAPPEQ